MSDDASLTDFVGDDGEDDGAEESERAVEDDVAVAETAAEDAVTGTEPTAGERDETNDTDGTDDTVGDDASDERVPPTEVAAATPTADWSPDGAACQACGEVVAHRWESDAGLVCPDCKEW